MHINLNEMQIDKSLGLSLEDIKADLKGSFKRVVIDGIHMADVLTDDYNQFQNVVGKDPDEEISRIYWTKLPGYKEVYRDMKDPDIVGFLFSEKFYSILKKKDKMLRHC